MSDANFLVVVLDTVRARNMSIYGYKRATTPNLEKMELTQFNNAFSPAHATIPSHASLFTGSYPSIHQTKAENKLLNPELPTLAQNLSEKGYDTFGFSNNIHVSPEFNFDEGFDEFYFNKSAYGEPFGGMSVQLLRQQVKGNTFFENTIEALKHIQRSNSSLIPTTASWIYKKAEEKGFVNSRDRGANKALKSLNSFLTKREDDPFFGFLNLMEGHMPYLAPNEYINRFDSGIGRNVWGDYEALHAKELPNSENIVSGLEAKYDGSILYLDYILNEIIHTLENHSVLEDTFVFFLSDHGEGFGEHNLYGHSGGLYNEIIRVPLLVRKPEEFESKEVDQPVSIQWIMPTILHEAGITIPDMCVDEDIFGEPDQPVIFESPKLGVDANHPKINKYFQPMKGTIHDGLKLIKGESWEELYDIQDKEETKELMREHDLNEILEAELQRFEPTSRKSDYSNDSLSNDAKRQLRKLGYME